MRGRSGDRTQWPRSKDSLVFPYRMNWGWKRCFRQKNEIQTAKLSIFISIINLSFFVFFLRPDRPLQDIVNKLVPGMVFGTCKKQFKVPGYIVFLCYHYLVLTCWIRKALILDFSTVSRLNKWFKQPFGPFGSILPSN